VLPHNTYRTYTFALTVGSTFILDARRYSRILDDTPDLFVAFPTIFLAFPTILLAFPMILSPDLFLFLDPAHPEIPSRRIVEQRAQIPVISTNQSSALIKFSDRAPQNTTRTLTPPLPRT
jgi:hypothetical protein